MKIYSKILISFVIYFNSHLMFGKPLSQVIYEDIKKTKCGEATQEQVQTLNHCFPDNIFGELSYSKELDKISESIVFNELTKMERDSLRCVDWGIDHILFMSMEKQNQKLSETCSKLPVLKDAFENIKFYENQILSYEKVSDRSIRHIPVEDQNRYQSILSEFRKKRALYQEIVSTIHDTDELLSVNTVFSELSEQLRNDSDVKKVCSSLNINFKEWLNKESVQLKKDIKILDFNLLNGFRLSDDTLKKKLWNSQSKIKMFSDFNQKNTDLEMQKSILCRFEGRYGEGADKLEKLSALSSLAIGGTVIGIGRLASLMYAKRAHLAYNIARTSMVVESVTGLQITAESLKDNCKDKLESSSTKKSCAKLTPQESYNLSLQRENDNSCLLAASIGLISNGFSALGLKSVFKNSSLSEQSTQIISRSTKSKTLINEINPSSNLGLTYKGSKTEVGQLLEKNASRFSNEEIPLRFKRYNLFKQDFYDEKSIYIGVANSQKEGSHHYFLVAGKKRYDGYPLSKSREHTSNSVAALPEGVVFKINVPEESISKVVTAIEKHASTKNISCLHGICRVLKEADIEITDKTGIRLKLKPILTGIINGEAKVNSKSLGPEAVKIYSTSKAQLEHFLASTESAEGASKSQALVLSSVSAGVGVLAGDIALISYIVYEVVKGDDNSNENQK